MKGMRFIMGDFNQTDGSLPQTELWEKMGWKEVQKLGSHKFGRPIANTCKSKTVKDFIWISPEMVPFFQSVDTLDDLFPDHSILFAKFSSWGPQSKIPLWRKPKAIDWDKVQLPLPIGDNNLKPVEQSSHSHNMQTDTQPINTEDIMINIANHFESRVNQAQQKKSSQELLMQQRGRSKTSKTVEVDEYTKPITKSRSGDKQPNFHGTSLQYNRWFRQLRRLESYKRQTTSVENMTVKQKVQQDRVWRSIVTAPGFPLGFCKWWGNQTWVRANTPTELDIHPPTHEIACFVCIGFEEKVRQLEDILNKELGEKAKQNRIANPNKVFDDLKKPPANLVQLLDDSIITTITAIDAENNKITVQQADQFQPDMMVSCQTAQCRVIAVENDQITVNDTSELEVGSDIKHEKYEASLDRLFEKFGNEWTKRWDKHLHVSDEHWEPIISFFKQSTPPIPSMDLEPITIDLWIKTLRKKKAKAATGPDGWARRDLLNLPSDLTQQILDMLTSIENGQPWPQSTVVGIVHSLEKVQNASKTSQFRPITIFSLIYRTWSSIRSKQCLQHLIDHVPTKCYGNLPGRHAGQVWWGILQSIEDSHYTGNHLTGAMIDIVKCFNALPRCPLLAVCKHLGIHNGIIRGWASALTQMTRRFSIRGGIGPPLKSSTGFAEGCGLSVVAMVASNVLTSQWLLHKVPSCDLWTYVDNIELTSPSAETTLEALENLTKFTEILDLEIDAAKTFVWATDASERRWFRQNEQKVKLWARDLGGHVQYSLQPTNSVIVSKMHKFKPRWKDMSRSKATYAQKIRSLKTLAWPNTMHGISSVHISDEHHDELRTGAMMGLNQQAKGASPKIQLSLIEKPLADPGFHALWTTLIDFRSQTTYDSCAAVLDKLTLENTRIKPTTGPCSVLLNRLNQIHWSWRDSTFTDQWARCVDIWDCCIQELYLRVSNAWQQRILGEMSHRKTFQKAFADCNPKITMDGLSTDPQEASVLRKCLNGTFFTEDRRKHQYGEEATKCPFCHMTDGQKHRHWECEELAEARQECPNNILQNIKQQPSCVTDHGWIPNPKTLLDFQTTLLSIQDITHNFMDTHTPDFVELFTDGSCTEGSNPLVRLASWGVVVGTPDLEQEFTPINAGLVSGLVQTISRAELTAILAALKFALAKGKPFRIWSDSGYAIKQIHKITITRRFAPVPNKIPNHDLLDQIRISILEAKQTFHGIHKVVSHQNSALLSFDEIWVCAGNDAADSVAGNVFSSYPTILALQQQLKNEIQELCILRFWVHRILVKTGQLAMDKLRDERRRQNDDETQYVSVQRQLTDYQVWGFPQTLPDHLYKYNIPEWGTVATWIQSLHAGNEQMHLSWYQLYADFHLQWPNLGPWYKSSSKRWFGGDTRPECDFAKGSRWMSDFLTRLGRQLERPLPTRLQRPESHVVCFWTYSLPVSISVERFQMIEKWLLERRSRFRRPRDFEFDIG